ncbi:MAG TPA: lactate utilization protein [Candidatus Dormibacteraeota bacterium]|nr:lactate utilization protein [Candidatus Dormibacteraeota bacterium]
MSSFDRESVASRFSAQVKLAAGRFERLSDLKGASAYITKIALARNAKRIVLSGDSISSELLNQIVQGPFEVTSYANASRDDFYRALRLAEIGVSSVDLAVAETGTLIISTTDESNRLVTALPEVHVAIVPRSALVSSLKEAGPYLSDTIRNTTGPVTVSLISASSRTSDIADIVILGVHGPKELHVLLLDWERPEGL